MQPKFKQFEAGKWPVLSAELIQKYVEAALHDRGKCSVLLTGGRSAEKLYAAWAGLGGFRQLAGASFYFGDERCVPPGHPESNYGLAMRSLFARGVPCGCSVFRMEADDPDRVSAARRYGEILPDKIDVMLFGVGADGHIASMFPESESLREIRRKVVPVIGPTPPRERLTITPPVIARANAVFVLAPGKEKSGILERVLNSGGDFMTLPVLLPGNGIWLLDDQATEEYQLAKLAKATIALESADEST